MGTATLMWEMSFFPSIFIIFYLGMASVSLMNLYLHTSFISLDRVGKASEFSMYKKTK